MNKVNYDVETSFIYELMEQLGDKALNFFKLVNEFFKKMDIDEIKNNNWKKIFLFNIWENCYFDEYEKIAITLIIKMVDNTLFFTTSINILASLLKADRKVLN